MKQGIFIFLLFPSIVFAQEADRRAIYNASMDYLEGMYQADAARIKKSVHPDVLKQGFYWKGKTQSFSDITQVSYEQMIQIARDWNRDGWLPADAPKKIDILDIQEKIANVKVTAYWGIDYLQLVKYNDSWVIINILWQNWPKYPASGND